MRTLLAALATGLLIGGCSGASSTPTIRTPSVQRCASPIPTSTLLASDGGNVIRMTSAGPQGLMPGTKGVLPSALAISHRRCAVAMTTDSDDSAGPLVVEADGGARRLRPAVGPANGIAWSPDDHHLAISYQLGSHSWVRRVDAATGRGPTVALFGRESFAYQVAWENTSTILVMLVSLSSPGVTIDRITIGGRARPFLTPSELGVDGFSAETFAVDATHHRLLLEVYSGTLGHPTDRRLVWVDLASRRMTSAMPSPLGPVDAQLAAVFGPGGRGVAFPVGKAGSGRYTCAIVDDAGRRVLPGNRRCFAIAWG
jgi:hypothetical protein